MRSIKFKIVAATVILSCLLSVLVIGFAQAVFHRLVYSNALEAHTSYMLSVSDHVSSEVDEAVHPTKILAHIISNHPLVQQPTAESNPYEVWQRVLSPYVVEQLTVASPTETLSLFLFDANGKLLPQRLVFNDANQNGYLDYPVVVDSDLDALSIEALLRSGRYPDGMWLPITKYSRLKHSEKVYWRLAMPLYRSAKDERPAAILILKGPFSLFTQHFPKHITKDNPALAFYENEGGFLSKTDFFPFDDLTAIKSSSSERLIDPGTTTTFSLMNVTNVKGMPYTLLSTQMATNWTLLYAFPTEHLTTDYDKNKLFAWLIAGLFMLITAVYILWIADYLETPILALIRELDSSSVTNGMLKITEDQQSRSDELGVLMRTFMQLSQSLEAHRAQLLLSQHQLEDQVSSKNKALTQVHKLLSESIHRFHEQEEALQSLHNRLNRNLQSIELTQHQLMRQEKTSSLKFLASGVAHELNTPIGNAITLASFIEQELLWLTESLTNMTADSTQNFSNHVSTIQDALEQLAQNLRQASGIIFLLETMLPDNSAINNETFNLFEFLTNRLSQMLTQAILPVTLEVHCDRQFEVQTDPNQLAMLLMPLVQNSLDHGFDCTDSGSITVTVTPQSGGILLCYEDDGCGIDSVQKAHILTPFFTTRMGRHKGLGLNLAYNIASFYFKGYIEVMEKASPGIKINCYLHFE